MINQFPPYLTDSRGLYVAKKVKKKRSIGETLHNITLEPTGLSVKHFARSKMLATEARGSAWR